MPLNTFVSNLLRQEILDLHAYHVPDSGSLIKLDAMENPYLLPISLRDEIARTAGSAEINRYPDPVAKTLKDKIRAATGLPDDMGVMLGNGSDELIQILAMAVNKPGAVLMSIEPSFVMYKMISTFTGMRYVGVPLTNDFSLDLPAMLSAIEREQPALIFLAYPNNPTGNLFPADAVTQIIARANGLVVVDEAYYAFASDSFLSRLPSYQNLLVMRTFSKLGMAGLRLGFLAGGVEWLSQLEKLRLPYNVGVLPQLVAEKLLDHHDVLLQQAKKIRSDRESLYRQMAEMDEVEVYPSEANFLLFRVKNANVIFDGIKRHGILIKNLNKGHPMLKDCLRVTVGLQEENNKFIAALRETIIQSAQG
jgi:histidinol-phosphate aminotransferase